MPCTLANREETLKSLDWLPKFSPMLTQLLARFAHKNCDANALADVVERDPMLAAQVLRLANSATFRRRQPIHSIKHAIALIGIGAMRRFTIGSSVFNLFSRSKIAPGFSVLRFNLHSLSTGTLVELLADELPVEDSENAFISGLLHDVGKMIIAVSLRKEYNQILEFAALTKLPLIECEREILGTDHAELSGLAIARWQLPEPVQRAGFDHHNPEYTKMVPGAKKLSLTSVIAKADAFVNFLGMSVLPPSGLAVEAPALEFAGFPYNQERTLARFQSAWSRLDEFFR